MSVVSTLVRWWTALRFVNTDVAVGGCWCWFTGRHTSAESFKIDSFHCQQKSSSYRHITRPRISQLLTLFIVHHRRDANILHMPWINLLFIQQFLMTSSRRRQSDRKPLDIGHARQFTGCLRFLAHHHVDAGIVRICVITISSVSDEIGLNYKILNADTTFPPKNFVRKATLNLLKRSFQSLTNFCGFFLRYQG